jgi:hypothetical protein
MSSTSPVPAGAHAPMELLGETVTVCSVFDAAVEINLLPITYIKSLLKTTMLMLKIYAAGDDDNADNDDDDDDDLFLWSGSW